MQRIGSGSSRNEKSSKSGSKGQRRWGRPLVTASSFVVSALGLASTASAATFIWDASGNTPANPTDGPGFWDTTHANLVTGGADVVYTNGDNTVTFGRNNGTAGQVTLSGATTVSSINFNAATSGSYTITGGTLQGVNGKSLTLTTAGGVTSEIDSAIIGPASTFNSIEVNGAGVLVLAGANSFTTPIMNINTGATVSVATLNNGNVAGPLGESSGGVRIQGGTLQFTGSTTATCTNALKTYFGGGTYDMEGTGVMNLGNFSNGTGTMSANRTITFTSNAVGNYAGASKKGFGLLQGLVGEWTGTITNGAKTSLLKNGTGDWYITGVNTYTGVTTIANGRLGFMNNAGLPSTTTLTLGADTFANNAILDMGPATNVGLAAGVTSYNLTVAGLASKGTDLTKDVITNSDTSLASANHIATLTVNPDGAATAADSTFGGVIQNGATSKVALTKAGSHTLTLSGGNTYTGGTTVTGGTLKTASTGGTLGNGNVNVTTAGAVLELDNNASISNNALLTLANSTTLVLGFTSGEEDIGSLNIGGTLITTNATFSAANGYIYNGTDYSAFFTGSQSGASLVVAAPEPTSLSLIGLGVGLALRRRHRVVKSR